MKVLGYEFNLPKWGVSEKAKPKGKTNPAIIQIVEGFKDNSRKDIQKWRKALVLAQHPENPKLNLLQDLISDLLTDGHLQSQIQMRKSSTLNTDFRVINRNTGEENEELSFLVQQQWFYEFLEVCLDTILFGYSVIDFHEFAGEKITFSLIPRRNTAPTKGKIFPDVSKDDFISYLDPKFENWVLPIGKPTELGILNNIVPNLIWKRNVMQAWAEFCEKFGMPLITATTNSNDQKVVDLAHEMLLGMGEMGVATFPQGTEIKYHEANRTDAYNVYLQFMQSNANEISKQLVGSATLSDQNNNRSQTEVHERTLDFKISQADKRMIQFIVNDRLFPLLKKQGYNIGDDDFFQFKTAEQEVDLDKLWNITNGLLTNGYEVEQEWISKTFNIPLEGKKKALTTPNIASAHLPMAMNQALNINEHNERYPFSCTCGEHIRAIGQPSQEEINRFTDELVKYVFEGKDTIGIEGQMISIEAKIMLEALRGNFKTFNDYQGDDHLALQLMEYNLFEFSASKTESRLASMKELLIDPETQQIRDFASFRVACDKVMEKYNKHWLESEYNLSIAVGQNAAQYLQFMAEKDSVTSFVQYQTIGDNKVRDTHQRLHGKIFNLADKEAMDLWPPNGYGCRCEMVQYLGNTKGKVSKGIEEKAALYIKDPKFKGSQFELNRGDLKQVFTKKQFYSDIKGLPEKLNQMTFDKYGLKKWADFKDHLKPIKLDDSITGENVKELFKAYKDKDYMGFKDYLGRKMTLKEKVFNYHTKGKYLNENENRHRLFPYIQEVLSRPDEVWYYEKQEGSKSFKSRYIKFYKDIAFIIECEMNSQHGLEILTWYPLKKDEIEIRKGLKIK